MALPNEPITRQEMYLSNIAGQNTALPDAPITREEMYLDYIAKNGGTGEGDMKKSVYDSDLAVASAGGIKMFVNSKIGTLPQRVGSLETTAGVLQGEVASIEDTLDNLGTASTKNSISVVTESSDLVESGAVKDLVGWGNKNKLPVTINRVKALNTTGTWSGNTYTRNGLTFTISTDTQGNITEIDINGTSGSGYTYFNVANMNIGSDAMNSIDNPHGNGYTLSADDTIPLIYSPSSYNYVFSISNNTTINHKKVYPMLEIGNTATAYEPYHASVEESLAEKTSWDEAEGYVGKNKFKISFDEIVSINTVGTWSGRTYTRQDVSFTVNDDLSITINGTNSGSGFQFLLHDRYTANNLLKAGKYIYTAEGAVSSNFYVRFFTTRSGSAYAYGDIPYNGNEIVADVLATDIQGAFINIGSSATVNNVTVKVMIREASVSDSTYHPYLISNTDLALTKADNSVIGTVEDGTKPTKSYAVGEHFIRNGKFCTCIVPVTTASTWSDGYYVEGAVGDKITLTNSGSVTISADSFDTSTLTITIPTGYTPTQSTLYISGSGNARHSSYHPYYDSTNKVVQFVVKNSDTESSHTWNLTGYVDAIKS